jgi:hypothetical protein
MSVWDELAGFLNLHIQVAKIFPPIIWIYGNLDGTSHHTRQKQLEVHCMQLLLLCAR